MTTRVISGTIHMNGREGASRSLREGLKDKLVGFYPDLAPIYCGSINVRLDEPLQTNDDCRFNRSTQHKR